MGLKKTKVLKSGISLEYWKVKHFTMDHSLQCVEGWLEPYITNDVRTSGANPINGERVPFRFVPEIITEEIDTGKVDKNKNPIMEQVETGEIIWNFDFDTLDKKGNNIIKQIYSEIKRTHPDFLDAEDA